MKLTTLSLFLILHVFVAATSAQTLQTLGVHSGSGRGCVLCHPPSVSSTASGLDNAEWGASLPIYSAENLTSMGLSPISANNPVDPIRLCMSCHDGQIAEATMMSPTTYEQRIGLTSSDATLVQRVLGEHPVGATANIGRLGLSSFFEYKKGGCVWLGFAGDCLKAKSGTSYEEFIKNYGAPSITSNGRSSPLMLPDENPENAYVVCTTCHDPHGSTTYRSNVDAPIAGMTIGEFTTSASIAAPFNTAVGSSTSPSSATQFCRQCHFTGENGANEAAGISLPTSF